MLTRWTYINRDFDANSRLSKKKWCQLIESRAVPGIVVDGEPLIDAALFYAHTSHKAAETNPAAETSSPSVNLLG